MNTPDEYRSPHTFGFTLIADSGAGFSRRDPIPVSFHHREGSLCGRLRHPYLIQPHFRTEIACEKSLVEFDKELRKKTDYG